MTLELLRRGHCIASSSYSRTQIDVCRRQLNMKHPPLPVMPLETHKDAEPSRTTRAPLVVLIQLFSRLDAGEFVRYYSTPFCWLHTCIFLVPCTFTVYTSLFSSSAAAARATLTPVTLNCSTGPTRPFERGIKACLEARTRVARWSRATAVCTRVMHASRELHHMSLRQHTWQATSAAHF